MSASIGIIGGADGTTAILVSGDPAAAILWLAGILLLAVLAVRFFLNRK